MNLDTPFKFLIYYTIFILFVSYISSQAGLSIFRNDDGMQTFIDEAPTQSQNILWYLGILGTMMSISTEFTLIYIVFLAPFIVGLAYIILEKIIDLIPG